MNRIPSEKESIAIKLFLAGHSTRMVAQDAGINRNTAWTLGRSIRDAVGTIYCPCGKVAGHKAWCSHMIKRYGIPWRSQLKEITSFNIYIPSRPQYERPDIANERETEVPFLINKRFIYSLDEVRDEMGRNRYEMVNANHADPLELLIAKEESAERLYRQIDIDRFDSFMRYKRNWCPATGINASNNL